VFDGYVDLGELNQSVDAERDAYYANDFVPATE
jgi:hypothetical protein